ncbi:hypothetical protein [Pseudoalteromonas denitrificans]|nr:hypothetical protein [Pseudoalteromonas denitrificans]
MKLITSIVVGILLALYPFAVYFGLNYFSPQWLSIIILSILILRVFLMKNALNKMPWILPASLLGGAGILISTFTNSFIGFKIYPILISFAMLSVFLYSYFKPPTLIETFARLKEPDLNDKGVKYTANVTLVWCVFFVINAVISSYTAFFTSLETWMIYNGFISYIIMACIMGIEFLVRLQVKKQHKKEAV